MCLIICTNKHKKDKTGRFVPFVAEQDIHVYKQIFRRFGSQYYTYYQKAPVPFKDGICEMTEVKFSSLAQDCHACIYKGIHTRRAKSMDGIKFPGIHHAIVPKGTPYFLGRMNDVVALKVLIFSSESDYNKYCKENNTSPKDISRLFTGW